MSARDPVISVDTKKKELVGPYKNEGREWEPKGAPAQVKTHDFLDRQGPGKAIPYRIYDVAANTGWISVGTDHDTAASPLPPSAAGGRLVPSTTTLRPPGC